MFITPIWYYLGKNISPTATKPSTTYHMSDMDSRLSPQNIKNKSQKKTPLTPSF